MRIEHGDCVEVLRRLADEGVVCDSCVTDPPYHLAPLHKRFANSARTEATIGKGAFGRHAKGFMGQRWDGGDVAFRKETWKAVYGVLRPGAYLLAFGGTRTHHRLVCAIEDAGFVIQDSILDLIASDERVRRFVSTLSPSQVDAFSQILDDLQPTGMLSWVFGSGFPKRSDQLKPAHEPICLAYKPGGARTLQIDECRIPTNGETFGVVYRKGVDKSKGWHRPHHGGERDRQRAEAASAAAEERGRWPANVCHDGSEEVTSLFPQSDQSPGIKTRAMFGTGPGHPGFKDGGGSAARFFYTAKADKDERQGSGHPTVKPTDLMQWLVRLVTPFGGTVIDPFAGTGSTGAAAYLEGVDSILIDRDDTYIGDLRRKMAVFQMRRVRTLY